VFNDLTEAHTIVCCELSEGLAFKYFIIRHLNQAHRQYVDSDVLACYVAPAATPLLFAINHTFMSVGCQGFGKSREMNHEDAKSAKGRGFLRDFA
jgi:phosphoribulokinase